MLLNLENIIEKYRLEIYGVLHVGGHHGEEASLYDKIGVDRAVFFEPDPRNVVVLNHVLSKYPDRDYKICKEALGSEETTMKLYLASNNGASNSLLRPYKHLQQYPNIKFEHDIEVNVKPLNKIKEKLENFNFMNIDVQGFELEVLKGASEILNHIDGIICEVNRDEVYQDCPMVEEIDEFLKEYGFERVETSWDGLIWGDAYYHKRK
jgi:FkbM family methyltransferase